MARNPRTWSLLWIGWTLFIMMVGVLPFSNFVGHSHWQYINWVPTAEQLRSPLVVLDLLVDMVANVLLFLPFGFCYAARAHERAPSTATLILLALCVSCGIELYQVYCHNRNTSLLDIMDNVLGAYLGLRVAVRFFGKRLLSEKRGLAQIPTR